MTRAEIVELSQGENMGREQQTRRLLRHYRIGHYPPPWQSLSIAIWPDSSHKRLQEVEIALVAGRNQEAGLQVLRPEGASWRCQPRAPPGATALRPTPCQAPLMLTRTRMWTSGIVMRPHAAPSMPEKNMAYPAQASDAAYRIVSGLYFR